MGLPCLREPMLQWQATQECLRLTKKVLDAVTNLSINMDMTNKKPLERIKRDGEWEMEIMMSDGQIVTRTLGGKKTYEAAWEYGELITTPHGHRLIGIRRA